MSDPAPPPTQSGAEGSAPPEERRSLRLGKVVLECETCGEVTSHRILHLDRTGPASRVFSGVAKCTVCQSTHPFRQEERPQRTVGVRVVVSDGSRSVIERIELARGQPLDQGMPIALPGGAATIRRIDARAKGVPRPFLAETVATLWAIRDTALRVPVSLIEGARTRGILAPASPEAEFEVGAPFLFEGGQYRIHAIRARGRNHESPGVRFRGSQIQRLYVHRDGEPPSRTRFPRRFFAPGERRFPPRNGARVFRRPGKRAPPR